MNRTPMPARTSPMPRTPFRPLDAPAREERSPQRVRAASPRVRDTGFSPAVKLAVRKRAGGGDAGLALCERCGTWLGQYGGDIQHIISRGSGGTSRPEISSVQNAALMCRRDHETAEARDPELYARGFWRWNAETPGVVPLMLHGRDDGFTRWLTADGTYSATAPGGEL